MVKTREKTCDYCRKKLPSGRKRFCCNKHKDKHHNYHNLRGVFSQDDPLDGSENKGFHEAITGRRNTRKINGKTTIETYLF